MPEKRPLHYCKNGVGEGKWKLLTDNREVCTVCKYERAIPLAERETPTNSGDSEIQEVG